MITQYDKFIVALICGAVALLLTHFHILATDATTQAIQTLVTAGVVYLVPNKQDPRLQI